MIKQWGISVTTVALITSASFGGMTIGALSGGKLANHIGRRRGFIYATILYAMVAWIYAGLAVFAFVAGCYVVRGLGYAIYRPRTTGRSLEEVNATPASAMRRVS